MKKTFLLTLALCGSLTSFADLQGNGYYRVQNFLTDRYVSVVDNRGSIDFVATNADLQAITLDKRFDLVCSDAASVLYVYKASGTEYNISTQGTSIYSIIDHYVSLDKAGSANGQSLYMAYGTYDGMVRYLGDGNNMGGNLGNMSINTTGNYRKWYIKPVEAEGDNYFGVVPTADATAGKHQGLYTTLYASFPFEAYSPGVKFYTIDSYGEWGQVTLKELTGVIPAATPVIVKCVGEEAADNKFNVGGSADAVVSNPNMKGVYFNCSKGGHINRVAFDYKTMRVLGVCEDGSLGFVQQALDYIPANTFYLTVPEGSPSEFKCVDSSEFSGIEGVGSEDKGKTVYTVTGIKIGDGMNASDIRELPAGLYIIDGRKTVLR